jgi:hypothetical protein
MAFDAVMTIGPWALLISLVAMVFFYIRYRKVPASDRALSVVGYFGVTLALGLLAYVVGAAAGIFAACSSDSSGNLCGLYGVFGTGPLLAGIAIFYFALIRARKAHMRS